MPKVTKKDALLYHSRGRKGKVEVIPTKPYSTQFDLSLAYTPGVAYPCLEIQKNPEDAYEYTAKGNLEDIKAPECFEVETELKKMLDIPVFHDDQHGTAIISGAGLINALEITGKKIDEIKMVVCGAGAAAISCSRLYLSLGVRKENIVMVDTKGVINRKRKDLNEYKQEFITDRDIDTLAEAVRGADLFLGLSVARMLTKEMLATI